MKKYFSLFILAVSFFQFSQVSFAHERRNVAGKYDFIVGFIHEPAFSESVNGLDLQISQSGRPVEGVEATLRAAVRYEDQKEVLILPLKTRYKQPGAYSGYFFPAKAGKYTFEITGTINGDAIKEVFESGSKFQDVEDLEKLKWPKS